MSRNGFAQCEREYNEREEQRDMHRREVKEERAARVFANQRKHFLEAEAKWIDAEIEKAEARG